MASYKVFVINLARSNERLANIKAQLDAINVPFERIDAVDGAQLTDQDIEQIAPRHLNQKAYHRSLSNGEIACCLSHRKAWQQIIDDNLDFAIVLEDDLSLKDNFSDVLSLISTLPTSDWDFIKLFPLTRSSKKNIDKIFPYNNHQFVTYKKFPLGCQAQAISIQAARKMVKNMEFITEPVDSKLKSWWELEIEPFGLLPYCVTTEIGGQSDINPMNKLEKMSQRKLLKAQLKLKKALQRQFAQPSLIKKFNNFTKKLI